MLETTLLLDFPPLVQRMRGLPCAHSELCVLKPGSRERGAVWTHFLGTPCLLSSYSFTRGSGGRVEPPQWPLYLSSVHTFERRHRCILSPPGCFVSGLYLEGADWDIEKGCLIKSKPKVLVVDLPILKIIPIEAHRLKLQVTVTSLAPSLLSGRD